MPSSSTRLRHLPPARNYHLSTLLFACFPDAPKHLDEPLDDEFLSFALRDQPDRVNHIRGVVEAARALGPELHKSSVFAAKLELTAYAHDIGYAPSLRRTGFHPLDGAIFMAHRGAPEDVVHAVLHHSGAREGARTIPEAAPFYAMAPFRPGLLDDAITYCDVQTSPKGASVTMEERIAEVETRYGIDSKTAKVMRAMEPVFGKVLGRVGCSLELARPVDGSVRRLAV